MPRDRRAIDDGLLGRMARQCRLTRQEFLLLVDCTLSREDHEAQLVAGGQI